jgi:membrane associated rhomboid family serine protease
MGYLLFYVAAGVIAGLAQVVVAPRSTIPAVGASGAIAGVLAVYLVLYPTAPVRVLVPSFFFLRMVRLPAVIVLGMWFVIQLFNGFLSLGMRTMATGGVAWFAHIGGFVAGLLAGFILRTTRPRLLRVERPPYPVQRRPPRRGPPW